MAETLVGLRRGIEILELLACRKRASFSDFKTLLPRLSPSTLSRLLKTLREENLLENRPGAAGYTLGPRAKVLGRKLNGHLALAEQIEPVLKALAQETGESSAWFEFQNPQAVLKAKEEMPERFHYSPVGSQTRNYANHGFAKLFFAHLDQAEQKRLWPLRGQKPAIDLKTLQGELATIKKQGWLVNRNDDLEKVIRICAPIKQPESLSAIGISFFERQSVLDRLETLRSAVCRAQRRAESVLRV